MKTILEHAHIVSMDESMRVFTDGFICYEDDVITGVGAMDDVPADDFDEVIDGQHFLVMPGMINAHTHLGMMSFRSLADDVVDRLRRFLFPLELDYMTPKLAYASARYACAEMLLAGVTTCVDMYYFEEIIAQAVESMGIRGFLGESVINQPTCDSPDADHGLSVAEQFVQKWQGHRRITPIFAAHAPITVGTPALKQVQALARQYDCLWTMHVAEMTYEEAHYQEHYGCSSIAYLARENLLDERLLAAHCILADAQDIACLQMNHVKVAHCIGANTKAGKGYMPMKAMAAAGLTIALGTDGPSSGNTLDVFTQMKLCADSHKSVNLQRDLFPAAEIVRSATVHGAGALGMAGKLGSLTVGRQADLVCLDKRDVNLFPCFDPYAVIVYSAQAANVSRTIVAGETVVKDKQLMRHDLSQLRRELETAMLAFGEAAQRKLNEL